TTAPLPHPPPFPTRPPSDLPVTFPLDPSSTAGAGNISNGTILNVTGVGSLVIDANQAGNSNYNPAPQVQQTIVVSKGNQTITFTSPAHTSELQTLTIIASPR